MPVKERRERLNMHTDWEIEEGEKENKKFRVCEGILGSKSSKKSVFDNTYHFYLFRRKLKTTSNNQKINSALNNNKKSTQLSCFVYRVKATAVSLAH